MAVSIRMNPLLAGQEGFDAGYRRAQQAGTMRALSSADTDPTGASNALLRTGQFEAAGAVQKLGAERQRQQVRQSVQPLIDNGQYQEAAGQVAGIDPEWAKTLSDLGENGRKLADANANKVGAVAFTIRTQTKEGTPERAALVKQSLQGLVSQGVFKPEQVASFDGSDAALQQAEASALGLKGALEQFNANRTYDAGRTDANRNYQLGVDKFGEDKRHNQVGEGQGAQRIGLEGARVGMEGQRLGLERSRVGIAQQEADAKTGELKGKVTESQAKDGFNAKRLSAATSILSQLEGQKTFNPTLTGAGQALGYIGGGAVSRQYNQAKDEWSDSIIRLTTGAAATKQEIDQANRTYFPSVGDPQSVVAQKAAARKRVEQDALTRAGPGAGGAPASRPDPLGIR